MKRANMNDAAELLAQRRAIELSAKVVALLTSKGEDIIIAVLDRARKRAESAMVALASVDAEDPKAIRALQNEIAIYTDLVEHIRGIAADGAEAEELVSQITREEIADLVLTDEDREAFGLPVERADQ